jgi:hypothetical protein
MISPLLLQRWVMGDGDYDYGDDYGDGDYDYGDGDHVMVFGR